VDLSSTIVTGARAACTGWDATLFDYVDTILDHRADLDEAVHR
jgi:hypothetical protein